MTLTEFAATSPVTMGLVIGAITAIVAANVWAIRTRRP